MLQPICTGPIRRRDFLRIGTLGFGGLGLADLLRGRAAAGQAGPPDNSVILFWMWGGPSQLETYDLKPDAPSEYRGPFRPIATAVPGLDICELFPLQARLADRFSIVRSLHHEMSAHNDGSIEVLTGKTPRPDPTSSAKSEHPDLGMIASKVLGARADGLPRYVGIPRQHHAVQPAYLGLSHQAFASGDPSVPDYSLPQLSLTAGLDDQRLENRRALVGQLDRMRAGLDQTGSLDGVDKFRAAGFQMLANRNVAAAFDLRREDDKLRDRYGRHLWGQSCLLARRLAEAGTSMITIDALTPDPKNPLYFSWDDHANAQPGWDLARGMLWRSAFMDRAISALIEDVYERGLDKKILVVALGEFGRTPRLGSNSGNIGRDHWPGAQSALVSGGGLAMGQVVGATTRKAEHPIERALGPKDLLATIYAHLGIDYRAALADYSGRPVQILDHGDPIAEFGRKVGG